MNHTRTWIIMMSQLTLAIASPTYKPQFPSGRIGRKIRNLPCASPITGETGICMFAATCERAKGSHLSTCIDRFYFGSCCKLRDDPEVHLQENTIDADHAPGPFVADGAIGSDDIPGDNASSKPIVDNATMSSTALTGGEITKAPMFSNTDASTTRPPVGLWTFQAIENYSQTAVTGENDLRESYTSSIRPPNPSNIEDTTFVTINAEAFKPISTLGTSSGVNSPAVTVATPKTPDSVDPSEASRKPSNTSTLGPSTTFSNEWYPPSTRFPPRNVTTTWRPVQMTTTTMPSWPTTWLLTRKTTARPQKLTTVESLTSAPYSSTTFSTTPSTSEASAPTSVVATEDDTPSTHAPGLITWSSYVNNEVTNAPETTSATVVIAQEGKPTDNSASAESDFSMGATIPTIATTTPAGNVVQGLVIPTNNFSMSDYKQVCGTRLLPDSRIVGGGPSSFGKWPWQLSLRRWNISSSAFEHSCGAVLLTDNWAITAAHCVDSVPWKHLVLNIGEHDMSNNYEPYESQERRVQFVFGHPLFDSATFENDIALLRFDKRLATFQPNILPICLPDDDEYFVGSTAYVTGWGRLYHNGRVPSVMREVAVPVISNAACEGMYKKAGYRERIPNIFMCAGRRKGGIDSCEGDSGGPMVIQRSSDNRWILAGIISWGIGCGAPNQPGVYTRISEFREWIARSIELIDQAYVEAAALAQ